MSISEQAERAAIQWKFEQGKYEELAQTHLEALIGELQENLIHLPLDPALRISSANGNSRMKLTLERTDRSDLKLILLSLKADARGMHVMKNSQFGSYAEQMVKFYPFQEVQRHLEELLCEENYLADCILESMRMGN